MRKRVRIPAHSHVGLLVKMYSGVSAYNCEGELLRKYMSYLSGGLVGAMIHTYGACGYGYESKSA